MTTRFVRLGYVLLALSLGCGGGSGDSKTGGGTDAGTGDSGDSDAGGAGVITEFHFFDSPSIHGVIDQTNHSITVTLPYGASPKMLLPVPAIPEGSTFDPGGYLDFTNPVTIKVYGPLGMVTGQYVVTVIVAPNPNVDLASAQIYFHGDKHPLTPAFSPSVTSYTATVPGDVTMDVLSGIAADPGATVTPSANANNLVVGPNTVTLTVAQPGGPMKVYTFVITRLPASDLWSDVIGALPRVPAGTFQRDATATNTSAVSAFNMARTEITRDQYTQVTLLADPTDVSDPTRISGTSDPVDGVSFFGALVFCNRLSILEKLTPVYTVGGSTNPDDWGALPTTDSGWSDVTADWSANGYRLPTEMEWLWAAMGATSGAGYSGSGTYTTGYSRAFAGSTGSNQASDYAWYFDDCKNANNLTQTRPVGTKLGNELGLFDMSGSAYEWVWDNSPGGSTPIPDGQLTDYRGSTTWSNYHPVYGGSFSFNLSSSLQTSRYAILAATAPLLSYHVGLRVVRNGP